MIGIRKMLKSGLENPFPPKDMINKVLVIGDGTLANEMAALVGAKHLSAETAAQPDVIVEAIIADRKKKIETLQSLSRAYPDSLILASALNASATEIASWIDQPNRVVGWAMLPPIEKSKVIEIQNPKGLAKHPAAKRSGQDPSGLDRAREFFSSLGKEAVTVNDTVGGVLPRVVANVINGAVFAVMEGVASPRDIDQAMKLGTNYPHGPLEWGDKIGLDQVLGIMNALYEAHGERYRPAPLLVQMAQAKRKFYDQQRSPQ
ncbi:MAG: 3-hydroxybutyryl-CoA dehydrogenase [Chloroflexi bacterium]|nr:3-hydroxybutyryl-CoA dehydrogenase [Chloroflexota bacterium]